MLVYRLCSQEEANKIFNNSDFSQIGTPGKEYIKNKDEINLNNHKYEENEMYMHFFPKFIDLFYLCLEENMYICSYDIPQEILSANAGYGEYLDFFTLQIPMKVEEYSIKSKEIKHDYLKNIDKITKHIDVEDYLSQQPLDSFCENIYTKDEPSKTRN